MNQRVFLFVGFEQAKDVKATLVNCIEELNGVYHECENFVTMCTHLVCVQPWPVCKQKFLCACAAGTWIVVPEYLIDSRARGEWLSEEDYEWGSCSRNSMAVTDPQLPHELVTSPQRNRLKLLHTGEKIFSTWKVAVVIEEDRKREAYEMILICGGAKVLKPRLPLKNPSKTIRAATHLFVERQIPNHSQLLIVTEGGMLIGTDYIRNCLLCETPRDALDFDVSKYTKNSDGLTKTGRKKFIGHQLQAQCLKLSVSDIDWWTKRHRPKPEQLDKRFEALLHSESYTDVETQNRDQSQKRFSLQDRPEEPAASTSAERIIFKLKIPVDCQTLKVQSSTKKTAVDKHEANFKAPLKKHVRVPKATSSESKNFRSSVISEYKIDSSKQVAGKIIFKKCNPSLTEQESVVGNFAKLNIQEHSVAEKNSKDKPEKSETAGLETVKEMQETGPSQLSERLDPSFEEHAVEKQTEDILPRKPEQMPVRLESAKPAPIDILTKEPERVEPFFEAVESLVAEKNHTDILPVLALSESVKNMQIAGPGKLAEAFEDIFEAPAVENLKEILMFRTTDKQASDFNEEFPAASAVEKPSLIQESVPASEILDEDVPSFEGVSEDNIVWSIDAEIEQPTKPVEQFPESMTIRSTEEENLVGGFVQEIEVVTEPVEISSQTQKESLTTDEETEPTEAMYIPNEEQPAVESFENMSGTTDDNTEPDEIGPQITAEDNVIGIPEIAPKCTSDIPESITNTVENNAVVDLDESVPNSIELLKESPEHILISVPLSIVNAPKSNNIPSVPNTVIVRADDTEVAISETSIENAKVFETLTNTDSRVGLSCGSEDLNANFPRPDPVLALETKRSEFLVPEEPLIKTSFVRPGPTESAAENLIPQTSQESKNSDFVFKGIRRLPKIFSPIVIISDDGMSKNKTAPESEPAFQTERLLAESSIIHFPQSRLLKMPCTITALTAQDLVESAAEHVLYSETKPKDDHVSDSRPEDEPEPKPEDELKLTTEDFSNDPDRMRGSESFEPPEQFEETKGTLKDEQDLVTCSMSVEPCSEVPYQSEKDVLIDEDLVKCPRNQEPSIVVCSEALSETVQTQETCSKSAIDAPAIITTSGTIESAIPVFSDSLSKSLEELKISHETSNNIAIPDKSLEVPCIPELSTEPESIACVQEISTEPVSIVYDQEISAEPESVPYAQEIELKQPLQVQDMGSDGVEIPICPEPLDHIECSATVEETIPEGSAVPIDPEREIPGNVDIPESIEQIDCSASEEQVNPLCSATEEQVIPLCSATELEPEFIKSGEIISTAEDIWQSRKIIFHHSDPETEEAFTEPETEPEPSAEPLLLESTDSDETIEPVIPQEIAVSNSANDSQNLQEPECEPLEPLVDAIESQVVLQIEIPMNIEIEAHPADYLGNTEVLPTHNIETNEESGNQVLQLKVSEPWTLAPSVDEGSIVESSSPMSVKHNTSSVKKATATSDESPQPFRLRRKLRFSPLKTKKKLQFSIGSPESLKDLDRERLDSSNERAPPNKRRKEFPVNRKENMTTRPKRGSAPKSKVDARKRKLPLCLISPTKTQRIDDPPVQQDDPLKTFILENIPEKTVWGSPFKCQEVNVNTVDKAMEFPRQMVELFKECVNEDRPGSFIDYCSNLSVYAWYPDIFIVSTVIRMTLQNHEDRNRTVKSNSLLWQMHDHHPPVLPFISEVYLKALTAQKNKGAEPWETISEILSGYFLNHLNCRVLFQFYLKVIEEDFQAFLLRSKNPALTLLSKNPKKYPPIISAIIWPGDGNSSPATVSRPCLDLISFILQSLKGKDTFDMFMDVVQLFEYVVECFRLCERTQPQDPIGPKCRMLVSSFVSVTQIMEMDRLKLGMLLSQLQPCWFRLAVAVETMAQLPFMHFPERVIEEPLTLQKVISFYFKPCVGPAPSKDCEWDDSDRPRPSRRNAPDSPVRPKWYKGFSSPLKTSTVNQQNRKGETPLHEACIKDRPDRVKVLLHTVGIEVNKTDFAGWTALHEACNHGHIECVRLLLDWKPPKRISKRLSSNPLDIYVTNEEGLSVLHDAVLNNHVDVAELLLQRGGKKLANIKNKKGLTPFDMAQSQVMKSLFNRFTKSGPNPRATSTTGESEKQLGQLLDGNDFSRYVSLLFTIIHSYRNVMQLQEIRDVVQKVNDFKGTESSHLAVSPYVEDVANAVRGRQLSVKEVLTVSSDLLNLKSMYQHFMGVTLPYLKTITESQDIEKDIFILKMDMQD